MKRKWVKRGEIEAERRKQYLKELEEKRKKRKLNEHENMMSEESNNNNNNNNNNNSNNNNNNGIDGGADISNTMKNQTSSAYNNDIPIIDMNNMLSRDQVIRLLRQYGQPITLFGETDVDRFKRLRMYELMSHEDEQLRNRQNDFAQHLKRQEQELLNQNMMKSKEQGQEYDEGHSLSPNREPSSITVPSSTSTSNGVSGTSGSTSGSSSSSNNNNASSVADGGNNNAMHVEEMSSLPKEPRDNQSDHDYVRSFFRRLLKLWDHYLQFNRSEQEKKSTQGRMESGIYKQTRDYIKPLFRSLKKQMLPSDILNPLKKICQYLAEKEYVKAHDIYLELSIGNAPWPMGVTMVGIHERSARERIETGQIAHILNDEQQRKYIQSVKRLMTFCQKRFPTDPSKMVMQ
jgi:pre-mRNA-splicing factor 18